MRRSLLVATLAFSFAGLTPAYAGFEWVPPSKAGSSSASSGGAAFGHFDNSLPQGSFTSSAPAGMRQGELRINPYPVAAGFMPGTDPFTSEMDAINRAMMEEAGVLNPVPLGGGYSTGMKVASPAAVAAEPLSPPTSVVPSYQAPAAVPPMNMAAASDMTPMLGGEVAPLPVMSQLVPPSYAPAYIPPSAPVPPLRPASMAGAPRMNGQPQVAMAAPMAALPPYPPSSAPQGFSEAVGFGRDLPLALALSQVIPPEYALSFETGVNAGANVSWEGGKPWNQVLQEMLTPLGLHADVYSGKVYIRGA